MKANPFTPGAPYALMMISAKGGVGKSTMTVNLAAALTARGKKVGIFDADLYGPNIPALLGIRQRRRLDIGRNPDGMFPIEARPDALDMRPLQPFERYGIRLMSLALLVGDDQAISPASDTAGLIIAMLLRRVDWGDVDVLLIDMPPGTGEPLTTFLHSGAVDGALLITLREQLSHLDNGRLVNMLGANHVPVLGVVENMTHVICPKCGELIEMYPAPAEGHAAYGGAPVLASVPFHPHLIRQNWREPPLSQPESPATHALLALADVVSERIAAGVRAQPSQTEDCEDCP
ncbi:MAG: P-loop NTPase [Anaerolineae bacterium]|nr:P-loop NTPase [Anaerolineae bacterium]